MPDGAVIDTGLYEMLQEYMAENEALRTENFDLHNTRERIRREQQLLYRENEKLVKRLEQSDSGLSRSGSWQQVSRHGSLHSPGYVSYENSPVHTPVFQDNRDVPSIPKPPDNTLVSNGTSHNSRPPPPQGSRRPPHRLPEPVNRPPQANPPPIQNQNQNQNHNIPAQRPPPFEMIQNATPQKPPQNHNLQDSPVQKPTHIQAPRANRSGQKATKNVVAKVDHRFTTTPRTENKNIMSENDKLASELAMLDTVIREQQAMNRSKNGSFNT